MNKTEFLLRLKLQKGLSYLKILQVMQQMPPDEDVDHEWLNCLMKSSTGWSGPF